MIDQICKILKKGNEAIITSKTVDGESIKEALKKEGLQVVVKENFVTPNVRPIYDHDGGVVEYQQPQKQRTGITISLKKDLR